MHVDRKSFEVDSYAGNANPTDAEIFVTLCNPNVFWPLSRDHQVHEYVFASLSDTNEILDFFQFQ